MNIIESHQIPKMRYVVQCYISDRKGVVICITEYTMDQLEAAYMAACKFYNNVLPVPDNGRYEDFV